MITKINNQKKEISEIIYSIFQVSYNIEADLLNATNFPPLKRTLNDLLKCNNTFFAYYLDKKTVGIIEIDNNTSTHIQSLVVHPNNFRAGIGKSLVNFVLNYYKSKVFTVETGVANYPAIQLYKQFNFQEVKQWDTDHGVRKISFERHLI